MTKLLKAIQPTFVFVTFVGLMIFCLALAIAHFTGATAGSLPDWVAAISTLAAFLAAGIAVHFANRAHVLEVRREEARVEAEVRAQADRFAGWLTSKEVKVGYTASGSKFQAIGQRVLPAIALRNSSDMPVYEVVACVLRSGRIAHTCRVGVAPPASEAETHAYQLEPADNEPGDHEITLHLEFVDAAGRRWLRIPGHQPELLDRPTLDPEV